MIGTNASPAILSPGRLLRLYMLIVLATAAAAIAAVLLSVSRVDQESRSSARQSHAAVIMSQLQAQLAEPTLQLGNGYIGLLLTPEFQALPEDMKQAVRKDVASAFVGDELQHNSSLPMPMSDRDLLTLHDRVGGVQTQVDNLLVSGRGQFDLSGVATGQMALKNAFDKYLADGSLSSYNTMFHSIIQLRADLNKSSSGIADDLAARQNGLAASTKFARYMMAVALATLVLITGGATVIVGRLLHGFFSDSERERTVLLDTAETLKYRNVQLTALYNVFTEITETLSLTYVIKATLREALKVMHANMIVIRLLKGDELVTVGGLNDKGQEFSDLPPVPLGDGPVGRAARRGRSVRIRRGAQEELGPSPNPEGRVESGIVVPLIVGARVVGTIACWSRQADAFSDEDEHVLEMMASQVATAVVAADTTDTSDHRARHDPLTGLPNRLQLNDDIGRELAGLASQGRQAVVAMADIDYFKRFNDDFGHRVGDVTLQKVASVMRTAVRDRDRVYRYGGEEFVMVFVDAGASEALALAERVRAAVASTPLSGDHLEPVGPINISIGLAVLPEHGIEFGSLIEMADNAMYRAKDAGRNRVVLWQKESDVATLVA